MYSSNVKVSNDNIGIEQNQVINRVGKLLEHRQVYILKFFNYSYSTSSHAISKEMGEDDTRL